MKILSIETSGRSFGVAISVNGKVVSEIFDNKSFIHSTKLVPKIEKLLKSAGWALHSLDKIAVSTGPGSFTGIRVGLTCAKMLSHALDIPVVGIDTLKLLCAAVPKGDYKVIAAIDAGRGEVYVRNKTIEIVEAKKYFDNLKNLKKNIMIVGNASLVYRDIIGGALKHRAVQTPERYAFPRAGVLAVLAEKMRGNNYGKVKPLYIRRSWAEEKIKSSK